MPKQMMFDNEARMKILKGIDGTVDAMKLTIGPVSRSVLIEKGFGAPSTSKDGITIAKEIEFKDPFENMGAKLVTEVAEKTSEEVGDGTTTAAILARAIYSEGLKFVASGADPVAIKRGIDKSCAAAATALKNLSKPVKGSDDLRFIATIASNNDAKLGDLIATALHKAGKEGIVTVEDGKSTETVLEYTEGMQLDKGYASPYFINNPEKLTCDLEDAYVLCYDQKISAVNEILPLLDKIVSVGKAILIIADDIEGEALTVLLLNRMQGTLNSCAIKAPAFGDRKKAVLEDIAALTGGAMISEDLGKKLENATLADLGVAKKVIVEKDKCIIIASGKNRARIDERASQIRQQIKSTTSDYDREKLEERLARLAGGVAVIKTGGITEAEMKQKKAVAESALDAARAALEEGYALGGGMTLLKLRDTVAKTKLSGDEEFGRKAVIKALGMPIFEIAHNAGYDPVVVVDEAASAKGNVGFNAANGKFEDLMKKGVIDPVKTLRVALLNASSISSLLLTSNTLITELKEDKNNKKDVNAVV